MGRLTTHVLDTSLGRPGAGIAITLFALGDGARQELTRTLTNDDGRCDAPLLEGPDFKVGTYELEFAAGAYFRNHGTPLADPAFLETVPIRFGIADASSHYHVPLLLSPYSYSTYRGS